MAYQPKSYRKFVATAATATLVASAVAPLASAAVIDAEQFKDVKGTNYVEAVQFLLDKGATNGKNSTEFGTHESIKRVDAAVWLAKVLELDMDNAPESGFKDLPVDRPDAVKAVNALKAEGIVNGKNSTTFGSNELMTRGQLAKWIVAGFELTGESDKEFTDVKDTQYADAVSTLVANDITQGTGGNKFGVNDFTKRGDFAKFLQKADAAKNPVVDATVKAVKAENGKVTVTFDKEVEAVKVEDFKLTQKIDDKEATEVKATEAKLSEDKKSVVLTVPKVEAGEKEQSVVVTATYKEGKAVAAESFKVEAKATEIAVESVSAITKTGVSFTISATTEAIEGFTVEVKDNTGKVVEVNPVNLVKGETEVTLTFKTALSVDPIGVWDIGGVEFNLDEIKHFNDIVAAAASQNEVTTLAALKTAGLANVKDGNITAYVTAINASATKEKLADIQVIIDKTNETAVSGEEAAAAVKAVNEATNQVQLLTALQHKAFSRVNPDWIVEYNTAITGAGDKDSVAKIQTLVDGVNSAAITTAETAADSVVKQNAVTELIKKYIADDVAPATTKADRIKASEIKSAVFGVKEANTAAAVYNSLVKLSTLDSANLPATALNANLKNDYFVEKKASGSYTSTATVKSSIVDAADLKASTAALATIDGLTSTSTTAQIKAALQKLADVTAHKTGAAKFDMSTVKDANLTKYVTLATDGFAAQTINSIELVNIAIAKVELNTVLETVNSANATTAEVSAALLNLAVVRTGDAGAKSDADAFISLSPQARLEVAQLVVDTKPTSPGYADLDALMKDDGTGAIKVQQAAHADKLDEFNALGDLASATTAGTKDKLDTYAYAPYVALTATKKVAVAEEINKLTKTTTAGGVTTTTSLNFGTTDKVTTLKQANDYINAAIAKVK